VFDANGDPLTTTTPQKGKIGSFIKIESKYAGDLTACDIVVVAKQTD
jgi:hypothetical protein